jgi:hypothetical protein
MNKNISKTVKGLILCFSVSISANAQNATVKPAENNAQITNSAVPNAQPMTDAERKAQVDQMKADRELNMKMGQLNKEIQEAEKAGKADAPEIVAKKAELKKMQEERRAKMMKDRAANPPAGQQEMMKINQLNKEIQEAEKVGKAEAPETVAKKAEVKKLQEERNAKMKAEREKMMKDRPMPTPEEMEANKKMGQLNKEIKDAEKEGKGETPEVLAKKAELKKMQEARMAKMKADREKMAKEKSAVPAPVKNIEATPAKEEKK